MTWVPIVLVLLLLVLLVWVVASAGSGGGGESAERARRQALAAEAARRLAAAYDPDRPLVLVVGQAPAADLRAWVQGGPRVDAPRALPVACGQDLLDVLAAATGEELPRVGARDADVDAHKAPTFDEVQHPLAGRVDLVEAGPLRAALLPLLRRWQGEGKAELEAALAEFLEGGDDADATAREALELVAALGEAAESAPAETSLALAFLPSPEHLDLALATISPPPAAPPPAAPPPDLEAAMVEATLAALAAELEARGARAGRDPDGGFTIEGAPLRVRAWPYARDGQRVSVAFEVEANLEGERRTFRLGFAATAPTPERALRLALGPAVGLVLPPLLDAAAAPREDVVRWSPPAGGDAPTAYEVHPGPVAVAGRAAPEDLEALLARHPFQALKDTLGPHLGRRLHLLDVHAYRRAGDPVAGRVRLDDVDWPEGLAPLAALPWPDDAPHLGVRTVVVIRAARL
ncbi:MAG: DUF6348 family protein [Planctomycetes bacterium]|nr:DUF6348 family protein [Planctomycetota bacterium]